MEKAIPHTAIDSNSELFESLIERLVSTIRSDQVQIETNTSSPMVEQLYTSIFAKDIEKLAKFNIEMGNMHFITKVIADYVQSLTKEYKFTPDKLAFSFENATILVWAQIKDDDETSERALMLSEAKVNAKYYELGYQIDTTIIEESDNIPIPNHYTIFGDRWQVLKNI